MVWVKLSLIIKLYHIKRKELGAVSDCALLLTQPRRPGLQSVRKPVGSIQGKQPGLLIAVTGIRTYYRRGW